MSGKGRSEQEQRLAALLAQMASGGSQLPAGAGNLSAPFESLSGQHPTPGPAVNRKQDQKKAQAASTSTGSGFSQGFAGAMQDSRSEANTATAATSRAAPFNADTNAKTTANKIAASDNEYPITGADGLQRRIVNIGGRWIYQQQKDPTSSRYIESHNCDFIVKKTSDGDMYFYLNDTANKRIYHIRRESNNGSIHWSDVTSGMSFALFDIDQAGQAFFIVNLQSQKDQVTKNETYQIRFDNEGNPQVTALNEDGTPTLTSDNTLAQACIRIARDNCINGYGKQNKTNHVEKYYLTKISQTQSLKEKHQLLKRLKHLVTAEKFNELYFEHVLKHQQGLSPALDQFFKELYGKDCLLSYAKYKDKQQKITKENIIIQRNSSNNTVEIIDMRGNRETVTGTEIIVKGKGKRNTTIYADHGKVYHFVRQANGAQIFYEASDDISIASDRMVTDPVVLARLMNVTLPEDQKFKAMNTDGSGTEEDDLEIRPEDEIDEAKVLQSSRDVCKRYLNTAMMRDTPQDTGDESAGKISTAEALKVLNEEVIPALLIKAMNLPTENLKTAFPQLQTQLALMGRDIQLLKDEAQGLILIDKYAAGTFQAYIPEHGNNNPAISGYIAQTSDPEQGDLFVLLYPTGNICRQLNSNEDGTTLSKVTNQFIMHTDKKCVRRAVYQTVIDHDSETSAYELHQLPDELLAVNSDDNGSNTIEPEYMVTLSPDKLSIETTNADPLARKKMISAEEASGYEFFEDTRRKPALSAGAAAYFDDEEEEYRARISTTARAAIDVGEEDNFTTARTTRQQALDIAKAWQNIMTMNKDLQELETPIASSSKKDEALQNTHIEKYKKLLAEAKATSELIKKLITPEESAEVITQHLNRLMAVQINTVGRAILNDEAISNTEKLALFNDENNKVLLEGNDFARWQVAHNHKNNTANVFLTKNSEPSPFVAELCTMALATHRQDETTQISDYKGRPQWLMEMEHENLSYGNELTAALPSWTDKTGSANTFAWVNCGSEEREIFSPRLHHFSHDNDPTHEHWRNAGIDAFYTKGSEENEERQEAYRAHVEAVDQTDIYHRELPQNVLGTAKLPLRDFQDLLLIGGDAAQQNLIDFHRFRVHYLFQKIGKDQRSQTTFSQQPKMIVVSDDTNHYYFNAEYDNATGDYRLTQLSDHRIEETSETNGPLSYSFDGVKNFVAHKAKRPTRYLSEFMANQPENDDFKAETKQLVTQAQAFEAILGLGGNNKENTVTKLRALEAENYQALLGNLKSHIAKRRMALAATATEDTRAEDTAEEDMAQNTPSAQTYHSLAWELSILETHYAKLTNIPAPQLELDFKNTAPFDVKSTSLASSMIEENQDGAKMAFKASGQMHDGKTVNAYFAGDFIKSGGNNCLKGIDFSNSAMESIASSGQKTQGARAISRIPGASRAFTLATGYELLLSNVRMPPKPRQNATYEQKQNITAARNHRASKIKMHGGLAYDNHLFQITRNIMLGVDLPIGDGTTTMNPDHLHEMIKLFQGVQPGRESLNDHAHQERIATLNGKLNVAGRALFDLLLNSPALAQSFATNSISTSFLAQYENIEALNKTNAAQRGQVQGRLPLEQAASVVASSPTPDLPKAPTLNEIAASLHTAGMTGLRLNKPITAPQVQDQASRSDVRQARAKAMAANRREAAASSTGDNDENAHPNTTEQRTQSLTLFGSGKTAEGTNPNRESPSLTRRNTE